MICLGELVELLGGELIGDAALQVGAVNTLEKAGPGELAFLSNPRYAGQLADCRADAVIVSPKTAGLTERTRIVAPDPYLYFARVARHFNPPPAVEPLRHPLAVIDGEVAASARVEAFASVARGASVGQAAWIGAGCQVGEGVVLGAGCRLHPNVVIYPGCVLGEGVVIHSGTVIGSDGFGYARQSDGSWLKIPQVGRVLIGDYVEIGANTTIDRGALDDTVIESGAILDNQIQVGHNVRIGRHTAIAGCVGIAGSTRIGERCMIGGQAGIIGHLEIADDVVISAGTLVTKSIRKPGVYTGNLPVQTHGEWVRNFSHLRHLDALAARIRALEQQPKERSSSREQDGHS